MARTRYRRDLKTRAHKRKGAAKTRKTSYRKQRSTSRRKLRGGTFPFKLPAETENRLLPLDPTKMDTGTELYLKMDYTDSQQKNLYQKYKIIGNEVCHETDMKGCYAAVGDNYDGAIKLQQVAPFSNTNEQDSQNGDEFGFYYNKKGLFNYNDEDKKYYARNFFYDPNANYANAA